MMTFVKEGGERILDVRGWEDEDRKKRRGNVYIYRAQERVFGWKNCH